MIACLIVNVQEFESLFMLTCHRPLLPPTNDKLDQDWSQFGQVHLVNKNGAARNLLTGNRSLSVISRLT